MDSTLVFTPGFELAFRYIAETSRHIFLTGNAGTGKTTFLKHLRKTSVKPMVVAAPTGVAAINAGGVTLHSLLQLPLAPFIPVIQYGNPARLHNHPQLSQIHFHREKIDLLRSIELLVIDEASMVSAWMVDAMDTVLRGVRKRYHMPFGGVQVLFIGDLHQLPPVVRDNEWDMLREHYSSPFFFDSMVLRHNPPETIELKEIFRQKDESFIRILNQVRNNEVDAETLRILNQRILPPQKEEKNIVTLTTHNYQADELNRKMLDALSGKSYRFQASIQNQFPENIYPAEAELELKKGAQVMFLRNDMENQRYFNGKTGVISAIGEEEIEVTCAGDSEPVTVKPYIWKNVRYSLNKATGAISEEELGSFKQYPLRLAWAITIHKSQGLTFDKVRIDAERAFANGQVYVALSRCRSLEGLYLNSLLNMKYLGAHPDLMRWKDQMKLIPAPESMLEKHRNDYAREILLDCFNTDQWDYSLKRLRESLNKTGVYLQPGCREWLVARETACAELTAVADRFADQLRTLVLQEPVLEKNEALNQRLKQAAAYFLPRIDSWIENFSDHPVASDEWKNARILEKDLKAVLLEVTVLKKKIACCLHGFKLDDIKKSAITDTAALKKMRSVYMNVNADAPDDIENPRLYRLLADYRKEQALEQHKSAYKIFNREIMEQICTTLPGTVEALCSIKGFGKVKARNYGEDIVSIVVQYCREEGKKPVMKTAAEWIREPGESVLETLRLYKEGMTVEAIAAQRQYATSTIEGHLTTAIIAGKLDTSVLIGEEDAKLIRNAIIPGKDESLNTLTALKSRLPERITFNQIRVVMGLLKLEKMMEKEA